MSDFPEGFDREIGPGGLEVRVAPVGQRAETRQNDDGTRAVSGYASVFGSPARVGGLFFEWDEEVAPGAFRKTLQDGGRVMSMFNHDPDRLLGTTDAGTARFSEDATGLRYDVDINTDDPLAMSVWAQVDRGDVNGASIWFRVVRQEITEPSDDNDLEVPRRRILEVQLFEAGPVVLPVFDDTTAGARSLPVPDGIARAAGVDGHRAARLTAELMADPQRAAREVRALFDEVPDLRESVCDSTPEVCSCRAAPEGAPGESDSDTPPPRHLSRYQRHARVLDAMYRLSEEGALR